MRAALDFISKDVKQYVEQNNLEFNDFESAALIYHSWLSVPEKHKRLEELAAETKDVNLRKQIMESLSIEKEDLKAFHQNTKGFVYVLTKETSDVPGGYFATPELAYAYGSKQVDAFEINKYHIVGQDGTDLKKAMSDRNPWLMGESIDEWAGEGWTAGLHYTGDVILQDVWSCEIRREDGWERLFNPNFFSNTFIYMSNPFEKGDIVRWIPDGSHGVVKTSQEEWMELLKKVGSGEYRVDF